MPRRAAFLALPLMLLTGLVLGQMLAINTPPVQVVTSSVDSQAGSTARAFYEGLNLYLETADRSGLSSVLAPVYVGHVNYDQHDESAEMLIRYLDTLRQTFPALRIEATELSSRSGAVAVEISLTGETTGEFGGIPLVAGDGRGSYEILRIENGQVAERWASAILPPFFQTVAHACVSVGTVGGSEALVERWTFDEDGVIEIEEDRPYLLVGESGEIEVQNIDLNVGIEDENVRQTLVAPNERAVADSGPTREASVLVQGGTRVRLHNEGHVEATLIRIAIRPAMTAPVPAPSESDSEKSGVDRVVIVGPGGLAAPKGDANYRVSVGLVALPPGSGIPTHTVVGSEFVSVLSGSVDAIVHDESAVWYADTMRLVIVSNRQVVGAGEGIRGTVGAELEYQAVGEEPSIIWMVWIEELDVPLPVSSPEAMSSVNPGLEDDAWCANAPSFGATIQ